MKKGFTLIEILVVVIIVGLLAGVAVVKLGDHIDRAQENYLKSAINMMERGMEQVVVINGSFPTIMSDTPEGRVSEILQTLRSNNIFVLLEEEFKLNPDKVFASAFPQAYALAQVNNSVSTDSILQTNFKARKGLETGSPEAREILVLPIEGPIVYPDRAELRLNDPENPDYSYYYDSFWKPKEVADAWQYFKDNNDFASEEDKNLILANIGMTDMNADILAGILADADGDRNAELMKQLMDYLVDPSGNLDISSDDIAFLLDNGLNGPLADQAIALLDLDNIGWDKLDPYTVSNILRVRKDDMNDEQVLAMVDGMETFNSSFLSELGNYGFEYGLSDDIFSKIRDNLKTPTSASEYNSSGISSLWNALNTEQKSLLYGDLVDNFNLSNLSDIITLSNLRHTVKEYAPETVEKLMNAFNGNTTSNKGYILGIIANSEVTPEFITAVINDSTMANNSNMTDFLKNNINNPVIPESYKTALKNSAFSKLTTTTALTAAERGLLAGYDFSEDDTEFARQLARASANKTRGASRIAAQMLAQNPNLTENQVLALLETTKTGDTSYISNVWGSIPLTDAVVDFALDNKSQYNYSRLIGRSNSLSESQRQTLIDDIVNGGNTFNNSLNTLYNNSDYDQQLQLYNATKDSNLTISYPSSSKIADYIYDDIMSSNNINDKQLGFLAGSINASSTNERNSEIYNTISANADLNSSQYHAVLGNLIRYDNDLKTQIINDLVQENNIAAIQGVYSRTGGLEEAGSEFTNLYGSTLGDNWNTSTPGIYNYLYKTSNEDHIRTALTSGDSNLKYYLYSNPNLPEDVINSVVSNSGSGSWENISIFGNSSLTGNQAATILNNEPSWYAEEVVANLSMNSKPEVIDVIVNKLIENPVTDPWYLAYSIGNVISNPNASSETKNNYALFLAETGNYDIYYEISWYDSPEFKTPEAISTIVNNMPDDISIKRQFLENYGDVLTLDQKKLLGGN